MNDQLIKLSFYYALEYKKDGKNFINTFKKYKSIRDACMFIVYAYKKCGAYQEIDQDVINFKPFAYKYFDGKDAQTLSDILLIIYTLQNENLHTM